MLIFDAMGVAAALFMIGFLVAICGRKGIPARVAYVVHNASPRAVVPIDAVRREYPSRFKNPVANTSKIIPR